MMKKMLPLLLGLAVLVSGCLSQPGDEPDPVDDKDVDDVDNTDTTGDNTDTGDDTTGDDTTDGDDIENETVNTAPTADLVANVTEIKKGTLVSFELSGSDADEDALTWTIDLGDGETADGSDLPTTYEHNFTTAGNFTVNLTVSDGTDTATASEIISVIEPDVVLEGSALVMDPFSATGEGCLLTFVAWTLEAPNGVVGNHHEIESTLWGWDYSFDTDDLVAEFWSSDFDFLGSGNDGEVPEGADLLFVCIEAPSTTADVEYNLTLSA